MLCRESILFNKNGATPASFSFIFYIFNQTVQFLQQMYVENVHLVNCAEIWTHDVWNTSLFPLPLDYEAFIISSNSFLDRHL